MVCCLYNFENSVTVVNETMFHYKIPDHHPNNPEKLLSYFDVLVSNNLFVSLKYSSPKLHKVCT